MELNLTHELAALRRLTPRELCARYAEAFGEQPSTKNKGWLLKRLAWRCRVSPKATSPNAPANAPSWPTTPTCAPPRPGPHAPDPARRPSLPRRRRRRRAHPRTAACPRPAPS